MEAQGEGSDNDVVGPAADRLLELRQLADALRGRSESAVLEVDGVAYKAPLALEVLRQGADWLSRGLAVSVEPYRPVLTTQRAADFLHVSRPYLIERIERGDIPLDRHTVGGHRRVKLADVVAYGRKLRAEAEAHQRRIARVLLRERLSRQIEALRERVPSERGALVQPTSGRRAPSVMEQAVSTELANTPILTPLHDRGTAPSPEKGPLSEIESLHASIEDAHNTHQTLTKHYRTGGGTPRDQERSVANGQDRMRELVGA